MHYTDQKQIERRIELATSLPVKHWARIKAMLKIIEDLKITSKTLLDLGCGIGFISLKIAEKLGADKMYGVDIDRKLLKIAQKEKIQVINIDLAKILPIKEGSMDFVLCTEVIEHLYDTDHVLDEIWRVMSPTGFLLISTPNLASWYNRLLLLLGFQPGWTEVSTRKFYGTPFITRANILDGSHVRVFTLRAFISFLRDHRFNVIEVKSAPVLTNKVFRVFDILFSNMPSLGAFIIVLCKKRS